jgi:hypothetical protein
MKKKRKCLKNEKKNKKGDDEKVVTINITKKIKNEEKPKVGTKMMKIIIKRKNKKIKK